MPRSKPPAAAKKLDKMGEVASRFAGFAPATQVLTRVRAVPTIFPQLNRATGIGGWPTQRIALLHGESAHGKTTLLHGLGLSFLMAQHFYAFIDAEFTTPEQWLQQLMAGHARNPAFIAQRPRNYEETAASVRSIAENIIEAKAKGEIGSDVACLVGVDSIRKLVPNRLLEKLEKGDGGIDGASGRAAMMRAALNAQWLDELVPLAYHAQLAIVIIARESENPGASPWEQDFKIGGGKALVYESSLVARVMRAEWVKEGSAPKKGERDGRRVVGEKHLVRITKTKVSGKEGKVIDCYFHTSNGTAAPAGFDRARDVFDQCERLKIIELKGSSYYWGKERLGIGETKSVQRLRDEPDLQRQLEAAFEPGEGEVVE